MRSAIACACLVAIGCTPMGMPSDAASDAVVPMTYTYVIARIDTATSDSSQAYGFDLDHMLNGMPGSCTDAPDLTSPITRDTAIDNQLSRILPVFGNMLGPDGADGAFRDEIERGSLLVLLMVSGFGSLDDNAHVTVSVALGSARSPPRMRIECATHADAVACGRDPTNACSWSAVTSQCSGIAAGQSFTERQDLGTVGGTITHGRLAFAIDALPLAFYPSPMVTFHLQGVRIAATISATELLHGEIGGTWPWADVDQIGAHVGLLACSSCERDAFAPDLLPDATGQLCGGVSAGFGFTAIAATITP